MKKFIDVVDVSDYEVLSDIGFVPIKSIMKTIQYVRYSLQLNNSMYIECADNHILIGEGYEQIFAKDSLHKTIITQSGLASVVDIVVSDHYEHMYDLELTNHHMYYTNNILSHNTTVVAAFLLHLGLFTPDYGIAILANKKEQAAETLDRIKLMYENLPFWLQAGVKRWNVNDIVLDIGKKGTKIFTAATKGAGIRGKTVNCMTGDAILQITNNETGEQFNISVEELYNTLDNLDFED